jgi:hypothetical protein
MNATIIKNVKTIVASSFRSVIADVKKRALIPDYVPTGLQEEIIYHVGCGKYQIVVAIDANRVGKTSTIVNIAKQIIWPEFNDEYFSFWEGENVFKRWPFTSKQFRITGTPTNLADNGALQQAISDWWPAGKYTREKGNKHFYSIYHCGEWEGDVLTYEQAPSEFEGKTLSLVLSDEPPKPALIGAINSRMAEGGLWVIGMTPINCGVFLDILDDLKDKGKRVKVVTGSIRENDSKTGKPNHNNTKRGLWTKEQIDDFIAGIPLDERPARCEGKASHKSGKVFPMFDQQIHGVDFDDSPEVLRQCNCFMAIDPHRKYYPAIGWYAITPGACVVEYDEYPEFDDLKCFYEEVRHIKTFDKTLEELADIILAKDRFVDGIEILGRAIDPHFHAENPESVKALVAKGVGKWVVPDCEKIETQRTNLQRLLNYNPALPLVGINAPDWYVSRKCKNSIRAKARHYWEEDIPGKAGKNKEAEQYKDFVDRDRYFLNMIGGKPIYRPPQKRGPKESVKGYRELISEGIFHHPTREKEEVAA